MSWNVGLLHFGASWGGGWGGAYRPGWGRGGTINVGSINIGNNLNHGNRARIASHIRSNPGFDRSRLRRDKTYNRPENRARNAPVPGRPPADPGLT